MGYSIGRLYGMDYVPVLIQLVSLVNTIWGNTKEVK